MCACGVARSAAPIVLTVRWVAPNSSHAATSARNSSGVLWSVDCSCSNPVFVSVTRASTPTLWGSRPAARAYACRWAMEARASSPGTSNGSQPSPRAATRPNVASADAPSQSGMGRWSVRRLIPRASM